MRVKPPGPGVPTQPAQGPKKAQESSTPSLSELKGAVKRASTGKLGAGSAGNPKKYSLHSPITGKTVQKVADKQLKQPK